MSEIHDLQISDANNTARWPDAQNISTINDSGRAIEGILARMDRDRNGSIATTGTGTAYVFTGTRTLTAHSQVGWIMFRAHLANTGAATLTISGIPGAKPLRRQGGAALVAGDIQQNQNVLASYNVAGDYYECLGITA